MKKTIYISKKTEEQFVSAVERTDNSINGASKTVYILKKEDGTEKTVTESTFKRWYKKVEVTLEKVSVISDKKPKSINLDEKIVSVAQFLNIFNALTSIKVEREKVHFIKGEKEAHHARKAYTTDKGVQFTFKKTLWTVIDI